MSLSTQLRATKNFIADFSLTIPDDLPDDCAVAGNCVLQWYWYATQNKQTYISCVDFEIST
jgi:hypothetical protein